jgi:TRAP-type mannitol/chloroaromatic compound transport system permease small subunit
MEPLGKLADRIDRLNAGIGRAAAWCALAMVLLQFLVVLLRYVFGIGSIWLTESILYAHATLFLMAAAWTLMMGGHVRVDIFYADASPRRRAVVDLLGALLLLLPFMAAIVWWSLPYVSRSWMILERSRESSGLPFVFLLKTLIPLFAVLLALQGIAQAIRAWCVLFPPSSSGLAGRSSETLDAPPELVLGLAEGKTRGRGMTTG